MINESMNHHHPSNATGNGNENTSARKGRKIHESERGANEMMIGHSIRDGSVWRSLGFGRRRAGDTEELEMGKNGTRPTTADTLVASEDMEGSYASDGCQDEESGVIRSGPVIGGDAAAAAAMERRNPINPPDAINLNLDADDPIQTFDNYNAAAAAASNAADNEIIEVPRGRRERINITNNTRIGPLSRTRSGSSLMLTTPRIGMERSSLAGTITPPRGLNSSPLPTTIISPLPPIFPYSPPPPPASRSRPRTAPTMTTTTTTNIASSTSYPPVPPPPLPSLGSRPSTADNSIRHHRLDSIRATSGTTGTTTTTTTTTTSSPTVHRPGHHHRTPPRTRESSPSRSVRFVDGESGGGGGSGSGKTVLVVEIPPPTPSIPSRSSSFYRDRDRQEGRTTWVQVDKEEGSRTLNATVSKSRPPTR